MDELRSWWEVPSIAHFCSLFRSAFDLSDFDIEDLEEALLESRGEDGSEFLTELVCKLLNGCYCRKDITILTYDLYVKDVIQYKWKGTGNPIVEKSEFKQLTVREKVELIHSICEYRLDAEDVPELLKGFEGDNMRVEPLGKDKDGGTYWYFYGSRLYKEDPPPKKEISKEEKRQQDRQRKRDLEKKRREEKKHKKLEKQKLKAIEKSKKMAKVSKTVKEEEDESNIRRSGRLRIKKEMKKYESETSESSSEEESTESSSSSTEDEVVEEVVEEEEEEEEDPEPKKSAKNKKKTPAKKTPAKKTSAKKTPAKQQTNKNTPNTSQRQSARQKSRTSSRTPQNTSVEDTPELDGVVRRSGRLRNRKQTVSTPAKYDSDTEEDTKDDIDSGNESGTTDDDDDTKSETSRISAKSSVSKSSQRTPVSKRITLPRASANIGKHSIAENDEDDDDGGDEDDIDEKEEGKDEVNDGDKVENLVEDKEENQVEKVIDTEVNAQADSKTTTADEKTVASECKSVDKENGEDDKILGENQDDNVSKSPSELLENKNKSVTQEEITSEIKTQDSEMQANDTDDKVSDITAQTTQEDSENHPDLSLGDDRKDLEVLDTTENGSVKESTLAIEKNENSNNCHNVMYVTNETKITNQNLTNLDTVLNESVVSSECQNKDEPLMSENTQETSEMEIDSVNVESEPSEITPLGNGNLEQDVAQVKEDQNIIKVEGNDVNESLEGMTVDGDSSEIKCESNDGEMKSDIKCENNGDEMKEQIKAEIVENKEILNNVKESVNENDTEKEDIKCKVEDVEEKKDETQDQDEDNEDEVKEKEASGPKTTLGKQKQFAAVNPVPPTPSKSETRWHLVCTTLDDWVNLAEWFSNSQVRCEKMLVKLIKDDFLPVLPEIIEAREADRRKRLQELELRRSNRITQKMKDKMEQEKILAEALILEEKEKLRAEEEMRVKEEQQKLEEENRLREERLRAREERAKRLSMREERARLIAEGKEIPPELLYTATNKYNDDYDSDDSRNDLKSDEDYHNLTRVIEAMKIHKDCWPFLDPVTDEVAPGYSEAIKRPMDLATIEDKVKKRDYKSTQHFLSDFRLMFNNCKRFNGPESEFTECARTMEQVLKKYKKRFLMDEPGENSYYRDRDFAPHVKGAKTGDKKYRPRRAASSRAMETVQKALNSSEEDEDEEEEEEELEPLYKRKKTTEFPAKVASHQSLLLQEMIAMKRQREKNLAASALENHKVITRGPERIRIQNPQGGITIMSKDQLPTTGPLQLAATREIKRKVTPQLNSMVDMSKKDPSLSITANTGPPARSLNAGKTIRIVAPPAQTIIGGNVVRNTAETVKVSADGYLIIGGKNSGIKISENTKIVIQPPGKPPPQTPPSQGTELVVKKIPTPSGMKELPNSTASGLRPINSTGLGIPGTRPETPRNPSILSASCTPAGIRSPQTTQHQIINRGLNSSSGIVTQGGAAIQAKPLNQVMMNQKQRMVVHRQLQQQQNGMASQSTPPKMIKLANQGPVRTQSSHMSIEDRLRDANIDQVSENVVKSVNIAGDILDSYYSVFNSAKTTASATVPVVNQVVSHQVIKPNPPVNTVHQPVNILNHPVNTVIKPSNTTVSVTVPVVNQAISQQVIKPTQHVVAVNQPVNTLNQPVNIVNQFDNTVNQPVNVVNQSVNIVNQPTNTLKTHQITAPSPSLNTILTSQLSKPNLQGQSVPNISVTYTPPKTVRFPSQNQPVVSPDIKSLLLKTVVSNQARTIAPSVIQAKAGTGLLSQVPNQTLVNLNTQQTLQTNTNTPQSMIVQQLSGINQTTQSININSRVPIQGAVNINEQNQIIEQNPGLSVVQQSIQNVNPSEPNVSQTNVSPIEALLTANLASNVAVNPSHNPQSALGQQFISTTNSSPSIASLMKQELLKSSSSNVRQSLFDMFTSSNKATVNDSIVVGSNQETYNSGSQGQLTSEPINKGMLPSSEMLGEAQLPSSSTVNFGSPLKTMSIMEALKSKLAQPNRHDQQQATNSQSMMDNKSLVRLCDTVASSSCVPANPVVCSQLTPCSIPASLSHITSSYPLSPVTENHKSNSEVNEERKKYALPAQNSPLSSQVQADNHVLNTEHQTDKIMQDEIKGPCLPSQTEVENINFHDNLSNDSGKNYVNVDCDARTYMYQDEEDECLNSIKDQEKLSADMKSTFGSLGVVCGKNATETGNGNIMYSGSEENAAKMDNCDLKVEVNYDENINKSGDGKNAICGDQEKDSNSNGEDVKIEMQLDLKTESLKNAEDEKETIKIGNSTIEAIVSPGKCSLADILQHVKTNQQHTEGMIKTRVFRKYETGTEICDKSIGTDDGKRSRCTGKKRMPSKKAVPKNKDISNKKNVYVITIPTSGTRSAQGTIERIESSFLQSDNMDEEMCHKERPCSLLPWVGDGNGNSPDIASDKDNIRNTHESSQTKCRRLGKVYYDGGTMVPSVYSSHSDHYIPEVKILSRSSVEQSKSAPELTNVGKRSQHVLEEGSYDGQVIGAGVDIEHSLNEIRVKHKVMRVTTAPVKTYQLSAKSSSEERLNSPISLSLKDLDVKYMNTKEEESAKVEGPKRKKYRNSAKSQQIKKSYRGGTGKKHTVGSNQHQSKSYDENDMNSSLTLDEDFIAAEVLSNLFPTNLGDGDSDTDTVIRNIEHELFDLQDVRLNLGHQNIVSGLPQQSHSYPKVKSASVLKPVNMIGQYEFPTEQTTQNVGQTMQLVPTELQKTNAEGTHVVVIDKQSPQFDGVQTLFINKQSPQVISAQTVSQLRASLSPQQYHKPTPGISTQPIVNSPAVFVGGDNNKLMYVNLGGTSAQPTVLPEVTNVVQAGMETAACTEVNSLGWNSTQHNITHIQMQDPSSSGQDI